MSFIKKKTVKVLLRKIYFGIFNSVVFDVVNHIYFRLLFGLKRKQIQTSCEIYQELPGTRILVLAPHIDDEIIGCGGAMLTYLQTHKEVFIAYLTDSQKQGSKMDAQEIITERREEALAVASKLGIPHKNLFFLGGKDGNLLNSDIEQALLQVLRSVRPDSIFLPILLDTHSDHYAATKKVCAAYATEPALLEGTTLFLYESQSPITLFHANTCLRITDVFQRKLQLLALFKSQPYSFKFVTSLNKANGLYLGNGEQCETFLRVNMTQYDHFTAKHFGEDEKYLALKENFKPISQSASLIPSYASSRKHKKILRELTRQPRE